MAWKSCCEASSKGDWMHSGDLPNLLHWRTKFLAAPYASWMMRHWRSGARTLFTYGARFSRNDNELGILDAAAIEQVTTEAWPVARSEDELHEALLLLGVMTEGKSFGGQEAESAEIMRHLVERGVRTFDSWSKRLLDRC